MINNKRNHQRVPTLNLLSYVCMDENYNKFEQGMGRAVDISQGGLCLETHVPIGSKYILLTAVGINDALINVKGRVVYCKENESGEYQTGVHFIETSEKIRQIVVNMIKVHNLHKE